jgi:murein DD-endopeptidase MepM/ murein hydrolase activator NlpD
MESKTSGTVRSALDGVVRSVTNDGGMWTVRVGHEDGSIIAYSWLTEADVGPGLTVARGQRIGLAAETESGFRVGLNAVADGEPCSALDLIR